MWKVYIPFAVVITVLSLAQERGAQNGFVNAMGVENDTFDCAGKGPYFMMVACV